MSRDLSEFVTLSNTALTTDSRRVARHFGKRHDNVLRAFDALDCSEEYRRLNFEVTMEGIPGPRGATREERVILMTKNGFMFLVMGFRGKKAAIIKEAYINAFDAMASQLHRVGMTLWDQRLELEKRDATSFMWASFGSKLMLKRKQEIPTIRDERASLEAEMTPYLFPTFPGEVHPARACTPRTTSG